MRSSRWRMEAPCLSLMAEDAKRVVVRTVRTRRAVPSRTAGAVVTPIRDLDILASLAWGGVLSTPQVERLHFRSRRRAQRRLRSLFDHELVRVHVPHGALHLPNVYTLTGLGLQRLVERGDFAEGALRPMRLPRPQRLAHSLAIRDVFVGFRRAEQAGALALDDFRFEEELAGEAVFRAAGLVPDAIAVTVAAGERVTVGIEVDLGTETTATLRAKCVSWSRLLRSGAMPNGQLLFVATRDARRRSIEAIAVESGLARRVLVELLADVESAAVVAAMAYP
jgi:hypothetical protein